MIATDVKNEEKQALDRLTNAVAEHSKLVEILTLQGKPRPAQVEQNEHLLTNVISAVEAYRTAFRRAVKPA